MPVLGFLGMGLALMSLFEKNKENTAGERDQGAMHPSIKLMKLLSLLMIVSLAFTANAFIFAIGRLLAGLGRAVFRGLGFLVRGGAGLLGGILRGGAGLLRGAGRLMFGKVVVEEAPEPAGGDYAGGFDVSGKEIQAFPTQDYAAPVAQGASQ